MATGGYVVLAAGGVADSTTSNSTIQQLATLGIEMRVLVDSIIAMGAGDQVLGLFSIDDGTTTPSHIKLRGYVQGDATGANVQFSAGSPSFGGLTTASVAVSSLPAAGTFIVLWMYYTNGSQVITVANDATSTVLVSATGTQYDGALPVVTGNGRVRFNYAFNATKNYAMTIDGAAVYSGAKTGAAQYAVPTVGDTGIVAFYRFDEGSGTTTADDLGGPSLTLTDYTWESGGIWDASTTKTIVVTGLSSATAVGTVTPTSGNIVEAVTGLPSATAIPTVTAASPTLWLNGIASATGIGTVTLSISGGTSQFIPVAGVASLTTVGLFSVAAASVVPPTGAVTLQYIVNMATAFSTANTGLAVLANVAQLIERIRSDQRGIYTKLAAQNRKRFLAVQPVTSSTAASARTISLTGLTPAVERVLQLVLADGRTVSIVDLLDTDGELAPRAYVFGPQLVEVGSDWCPATQSVSGTLYYVQQPTDLVPTGDLTQYASIPGDWADLLIIPLAQYLAAQDTAPTMQGGPPRQDEIGVLQTLYESRLQAFYSYCAHYSGTIASRFDVPRPISAPR